MSAVQLPERIAIDGVVELLRCPNFELGWSPAEIHVTYTAENWSMPPSLKHLQDSWDSRHAGERSDPKVALRQLRIDNDGSLICRLQPTTWREVRPLHERTNLSEDDVVRWHEMGFEMLVPNMGVVHVIVATADGWLVAFQRSPRVAYYPGAWSFTYEEGLAPADVDSVSIFHHAALRGLAEELNPDLSRVGVDAFRVVSVVLEISLGNPAVVVIAKLPLSRVELVGPIISEEIMSDAPLLVPLDLDYLKRLIANPRSEFAPRASEWHPSARYRLVAAIARFFGANAAAEALGIVQPA